jgi:exodeoxyribonuclease VII large subunit
MEALPVSALVHVLREIIEGNELLSDLWLVGEVTSYSRSSAGHRYFSLKDESASLRAVLFRGDQPGMDLKNGDRVFAHGRVSVYTQRGELQFVCDFVRPEGVGLAAARFQQLRELLEREGLFDTARKRPLPAFPRRIGIVTSPTGAAIQDIRNVLGRRWPLAELVLSPTVVQGEQAAPAIHEALQRLAAEPGLDLAILARGGGSNEDLWAFNDERVARAVFAFPVPVVTGIGHDTDTTIVDLVADVRAPTPSAAAERSTPDRVEFLLAVSAYRRQMERALRYGVAGRAEAIGATLRRLERAGPDLARRREQVGALCAAMGASVVRTARDDRALIDEAVAHLHALNPMATLRRGYAIVQDAKSRNVLATTRKVKPGQRLSVALVDGAFWVEVS